MFRKFIALILSVLFVGISITTIFLITSFNTIFDKEMYYGEFVDIVYEYSINQLKDNIDLTDFASIESFSVEDLLYKVITKDDIKSLIDTTISSLGTLNVDSETHSVEIVIPLGWINDKKDLLTTEISEYILAEVPKCEVGEVMGEDFNCIYEKISLVDMELQVSRILDTNVFSVLTDDFVFNINTPDVMSGDFSSYIYDTIRDVVWVLLLVMILLLFLVALLIFKPAIVVLRWTSFLMFFTGLVNSIIFLLLYYTLDLWKIIVESLGVELSKVYLDFYSSIYSLFISKMSSDVLMFTIPITLIFFIVGLFTFKNFDK